MTVIAAAQVKRIRVSDKKSKIAANKKMILSSTE
jgi:hypothetical protein